MKTLSLLGAAALMFGGATAGSLAQRFDKPPADARLRCWYHWLGDYITEEGLRADLDAMRRMELGGYTIVCAAGYSPKERNAPVMSDEWKRLVALSSRLAAEAGMDTGMHNCPGWTSSGGPWIEKENAMKKVVSSWCDFHDAEGTLKLVQPPTNLDFYHDIVTVAFPVETAPAPAKVTASFACDAAAVARGEASAPLKAWPEDGECSFTFEFADAWRPGAVSVTFPEKTHVWAKAALSESLDGATWRKVMDLDFTRYNNDATPQTKTITGGKTAKFFKLTFTDSKRGAWFKERDPYLVSGIAFAAHPVVSGDPGSIYEYRRRPDADRAALPVVPREKILDLTAALASDGTLKLPRRLEGDWRIVRIGYTLTGKQNHPARLSGLECDKLSPKGIDNHWTGYVEKLLALDGAPKELLIDSYEVGSQTWTEGMESEFRKRRGYALKPFLPVLAGFIVDSHDTTEKFLFDFSRTVAEMMADNYFSRFAAKCRAAGVRSAIEPYFGPFDGFAAGRDFDVPTGEFWLNQPKGLVRTASSLGHLYNRSYVAAESFSAFRENGRWTLTPRQLKRETDWAWLHGINRLTVHSYVHQPDLDRVPGVSLGFFGSHFNRNLPWWDDGVAWSRYVARGQSLLTAGFAQADILIMNGECNAFGEPDQPRLEAAGFDYDYAGADIVSQLYAENGEVRFPKAPHGYKLLVIADRYSNTLRTLKAIKRVLDGGGLVAAFPPVATPSLADDEAEYQALKAEIFGNAGTYSIRQVGKGRLVLTDRPEKAVELFKIPSPFVAPAPLVAVSREVDGCRVWFVSNPGETRVKAEVGFAPGPAARSVSFFDAVTGKRSVSQPLSGAQTLLSVQRLPLDLEPHGSIFVVFSSDPPSSASPASAPAEPELLQEIPGPWSVTFPGDNGRPSRCFSFPTLVSWSERPEPEIQSFAGQATYKTTFTLKPSTFNLQPPTSLYLDLGDVRDTARVWVNGREAGIAWTPPYRVEITGLVREGVNDLEIRLANNWPNRLIADARLKKAGGKPLTWTNYGDAWRAEDAFITAGLLGPVKLWSKDKVNAHTRGDF